MNRNEYRTRWAHDNPEKNAAIMVRHWTKKYVGLISERCPEEAAQIDGLVLQIVSLMAKASGTHQ